MKDIRASNANKTQGNRGFFTYNIFGINDITVKWLQFDSDTCKHFCTNKYHQSVLLPISSRTLQYWVIFKVKDWSTKDIEILKNIIWSQGHLELYICLGYTNSPIWSQWQQNPNMCSFSSLIWCCLLLLNLSGTLSRCLESLERIDKEHTAENTTSEALKQVPLANIKSHLH